MIIIRILLAILALPLLIATFVLKLLFKLISNFSTTISLITAVVFIIPGTIFVFSALFGTGDQFTLGCIITAIGFLFFAFPHIADFLEYLASALFNFVINTFYRF